MPPTRDPRSPKPAKLPAAAREEQKLAHPPQAAKPAPVVAQRAQAQPDTATPRGVLALQRRYSNRAVKNLAQPKLQVGPADDAYEREADRAAEQVLRGAVRQPTLPGHAHITDLAGAIAWFRTTPAASRRWLPDLAADLPGRAERRQPAPPPLSP